MDVPRVNFQQTHVNRHSVLSGLLWPVYLSLPLHYQFSRSFRTIGTNSVYHKVSRGLDAPKYGVGQKIISTVNCQPVTTVFVLGVFGTARHHALVSLRHAAPSQRHAAPFLFFFRMTINISRDDKPKIVSFLRTFKFQGYSLGDNSHEDATVVKR